MDTTALPAWLSSLSALPDSIAFLILLAFLVMPAACAAALARSSRERRLLAEDLSALQTDKALAEERLAQVRQRLGDLEQDLAEAQERAASLASENRDLVQNGASLQSQVELLQMDKAQLRTSLDQETERGRAEAKRWASEMASLREENAKLAQQMAGIGEMRARDAEDRAKALKLMEARIGDVGRQMLAERAEDLRKRSEETLTLAVAPLAQQLDGFRSLVDRTAQHSSEQAGRLAEQIAGLQSAQASLSKQAEDLVRALAKGGKAQGLWGERQLEKVLDASGLEAGRDYVREADAQDGDGRKLRPDCVVRLPQGRHLVVDAKCSLTAYAEACAAESGDARREAMARHVKSVRAHVKELAAKRYGDLACFNAPGFVFMFVPIDGALSSALEAAPGLYDEAQREGVYLVSPSTLLPALRVASSLWMLARQNERVQAIAASAGKVHDRLAAVLGALADADKRRQALNASFDTLASRLQHGSRSLAAMLEAFSAKASLEQVKAALASDAGALAESRSKAQASGEAACQTQSTRVAPALGATAMHDGQAMHTGQGVQSGQPVQAAQALRALRERPAGEALRQSSAKQGSLLAATAIRRDAPRTPATQQPSSHQNSAHQLSASLQAPYDGRFPVWDEGFDQAPLPAGDAEGMRE
nr:DNA recombination protein RmuC [Desulfovibrio sp.]